jgi:hypothetical protein
MKDDILQTLQTRVDHLERRWHSFSSASLLLIVLAAAAAALQAGTTQPESTPILRARGLIIVDDRGRERIFVGAPVPDLKEGKRRSPSTGLVINDAAGYERFGLSLTEDGRIVMGFDAPPGTGDSRNRERITIVADAAGGAYVRFLNRKTFVAGRLVLDDKDQFSLEFLDFPEGKAISRRMSVKGEETVEQKR